MGSTTNDGRPDEIGIVVGGYKTQALRLTLHPEPARVLRRVVGKAFAESDDRALVGPALHHSDRFQPLVRAHAFGFGRQLQVADRILQNAIDDGEAADAMDLPAEAIREATTYANANEELLAAEAEYERLSLALRGLGSDTRPVPR